MSEIEVVSRLGRAPLQAFEPGGEVATVPADTLVLEIRGSSVPAEILLDGRRRPTLRSADGTRATVLLDERRSVGYHQLVAGAKEYRFATADAKLGLEGIVQTLRFVGRSGLAWSGQFIFEDGRRLRDARIDFAWLDSRARRLLRALAEIADSPSRGVVRSDSIEVPSSRRCHLGRTVALLRGQLADGLERHPAGVLRVSGEPYMPRRVAVSRASSTVRWLPNVRAAHVLDHCTHLSRSLLETEDLPGSARREVRDFHRRFLRLYESTLFRQLNPATESGLPEAPHPVEMTEWRYQQTYQVYCDLCRGNAWSAGTQPSSYFAYVSYADEVFQAFVALVVAHALGLSMGQRPLRANLSGPVCESDEYELYYDTVPPQRWFRNWRMESERQAEMKPDIAIVSRTSDGSLLGDAKYRVRQEGALPSSALQDCQVYLQTFGRRHFVVFYPGKELGLSRVAGGGYEILEVSLLPIDGVLAFASDELLPQIERLLE